jgi:hypothetical protein
MTRYTVAEAAEVLGTTTGAVRNRLSRGSLQSVKEEGTVYVLLPADITRGTERDAVDDRGESTSLTFQMQARIDSLERQLEEERAANRENRRLLAAALERIPPQLEAPSESPSEPRESPETATEEEAKPHPGGVQGGAQRPWWKRWFGG